MHAVYYHIIGYSPWSAQTHNTLPLTQASSSYIGHMSNRIYVQMSSSDPGSDGPGALALT